MIKTKWKNDMTYRLLWADDEVELLKAHIIFLQSKGYEVTTVTNGPDAIDVCSKEAFDLVLLDDKMPGLTGLEALNVIKEMHPQMPVVMVTKSEEEDIMEQAIGSKIADYLITLDSNILLFYLCIRRILFRHYICLYQHENRL